MYNLKIQYSYKTPGIKEPLTTTTTRYLYISLQISFLFILRDIEIIEFHYLQYHHCDDKYTTVSKNIKQRTM